MSGGRPTKYTQELAATICERIIDGNSLRKICLADDMPNRDTIHSWLVNNAEFSDQYAQACKLRRENKFEQLEDIAETEQDVRRARLKIDVIKWQLSKEEPKKYGDKMQLGNDPDNPLTNPTKELTDEELNARIRKIVAGKEN
jgi:hypothetical protein